MIYACISDVHGRGIQLVHLLERIDNKRKESKEPIRVVFLGDYCDRGYYNLLTIDTVMGYKDKYPDTVVLLGNHEEFIIGTYRFDDLPQDSHLRCYHDCMDTIRSTWRSMRNGGYLTEEELTKKTTTDKRDRILDFLLSLPISYTDGNSILFTHAPVNRRLLTREDYPSLERYNYTWNVTISDSSDDELEGKKEDMFLNVHGHIHLTDPLVLPKEKRVNVTSFPLLSVTYISDTKYKEDPSTCGVIGNEKIYEYA